MMSSSQFTSRIRFKFTDTLDESTLKTSIRKSSAYHQSFEQHLIDHRIYSSHYNFFNDQEFERSSNEKKILVRLTQLRSSLSSSQFSDKAFASFVQTNLQTLIKADLMRKSFSTIVSDVSISSVKELPFENLKLMTDSTLLNAKLDFYNEVNT